MKYDPRPWGVFVADTEEQLSPDLPNQSGAITWATRYQRSAQTQGRESQRLVIRVVETPRDAQPVRVPHEIAIRCAGEPVPWSGLIAVQIDGEQFPYAITNDVRVGELDGVPRVTLTLIADKVTLTHENPTPINRNPAP